MQCNMHCVHCLSASGQAVADELDYPACQRLIDQLSAIKVFQINIGGGEPFMRPDFSGSAPVCASKRDRDVCEHQRDAPG